MNISILCKVVDNFGDIGVVYRLAKRLKVIEPDSKINLIVDDLVSFNKICNEIIPQLAFQVLSGIEVYDWKLFDFCYEKFSKNDGEKLEIILECFQCGRPDWMEKILFEDKLSRTVHIIMIDYLTAEKYADDFHCLQSLTRSAKVQKINFMPGFTSKTGGLIIDESWKFLPDYNSEGEMLIFTYERNWDFLASALFEFSRTKKIRLNLAQGRGLESFRKSVSECERTIQCSNMDVVTLDYMNQTEWDSMMKNCSILFIRGEESMSRACLSGIPFVWHAYPQSDEYQMVKVEALLERMKQYFDEESFDIIKNVFIDFNSEEGCVSKTKMKDDVLLFLQKSKELAGGFKAFALDLRKNGDLAANLMTFIRKRYIIS